MNQTISIAGPLIRPEPVEPPGGEVGARRTSSSGRLWQTTAFRKALILVFLAAAWQVYAGWLNRPLLLPTFTATVAAGWNSAIHGDLVARVGVSLRMLGMGYAAGVLLGGVLTSFAISSRWGADLLATVTAAFNPLPAIALLPLALLWFGLGTPSMLFVMVHAVLWPVALNTHAGFSGVSETLRMVGRNYGLSGPRYLLLILIPAALPSILTGLKVGWAFAWRTLIAVELVFGVSSGSGGLGWYIYENRNLLEIERVYAGLLTIMLLGYLVENGMFRLVENRTVRRWGLKS